MLSHCLTCWAQVEDVRLTRIDYVLDEISAYLLFDNNNLERLTLDEFAAQTIDYTRQCANDVAGKSYRVEESLTELVAMLFRRAQSMLKECVDVTPDSDGLFIITITRGKSKFSKAASNASNVPVLYNSKKFFLLPSFSPSSDRDPI